MDSLFLKRLGFGSKIHKFIDLPDIIIIVIITITIIVISNII